MILVQLFGALAAFSLCLSILFLLMAVTGFFGKTPFESKPQLTEHHEHTQQASRSMD